MTIVHLMAFKTEPHDDENDWYMTLMILQHEPWMGHMMGRRPGCGNARKYMPMMRTAQNDKHDICLTMDCETNMKKGCLENIQKALSLACCETDNGRMKGHVANKKLDKKNTHIGCRQHAFSNVW